MHSLITSYLIQCKECTLPGIGDLRIINTGASTDTANNQLLPPFEEVIFRTGSGTASSGLINYIAGKKQIPLAEAENVLNNFCKDWKEKIGAGERLIFKTLGSIHKSADGSVVFERERSFRV